MAKSNVLARNHLIDVLRYIAEKREPQNFDATGEAAYAALFQLGVIDATSDQGMLRTADEITSIERVIDGLDRMFNVIGNCPDEVQNLKRIAWGQVADQAQAAYEILIAQT